MSLLWRANFMKTAPDGAALIVLRSTQVALFNRSILLY
jgi:hypothetical protein